MPSTNPIPTPPAGQAPKGSQSGKYDTAELRAILSEHIGPRVTGRLSPERIMELVDVLHGATVTHLRGKGVKATTDA